MSNNAESKLSGFALWIAVVVILAWLGLILWLVFQRNETELIWTRLIFLLGSIEAVAFGAAGALFGTQIQRQRVADAKERANKAEQDAAANKNAASKGRELAAMVKAEAAAEGSSRTGPRRLSAEGAESQGMSSSLALANDILSARD